MITGVSLVLFGTAVSLGTTMASWVSMLGPGNGCLGIGAMSFVTPDTGFVSAGSWLWSTTDGGLTYHEITPPGLSSSYYISDIELIDRSSAYVVARGQGSWDSTRVFRTTDAGTTWRSVLAWAHDADCDYANRKLFFWDAQHGCALNGYLRGVLRTDDGGNSWRSVTPAADPVKTISFVDPLTAYAVCMSPDWSHSLWRTEDGGAAWSRVSVFRDTAPLIMQFLDRQHGYMLAHGWTRSGGADEVLTTTDAGVSWRQVLRGGRDEYLEDMLFTGLTSGFIISDREALTDYSHRMYRTADGEHFFRLTLPRRDIEYISPMTFVKGSPVGYVCCYDSLGRAWLFKTIDGGGESLDFWRPLTTLPAKPKRGALLASVPDSSALYLLDKGTSQLRSYGLGNGVWREKKPIPVELKDGSMVYDGVGLVVSRARSNEFWSYAPDFDTWARLPDVPGETKMKPGSCIASDNGDPLFALKGGKTCEFWSFDRNNGVWLRKQDIPGTPVTRGACLACDNDYVYALKGGKGNEFWAFSIEDDTWFRLPDVVGAGIKEGSCLSASNMVPGNSIACLKGGTSECWYYSLDGYWKLAPGIPGRKKVKRGAQLTFDDAGTFFAIRDARSLDIWQTDNLSMLFSEPDLEQPLKDNSQSGATQKGEPEIGVRAISSAGRVSITAGGADWTGVSLLDVSGRVVATVRPDRTTTGGVEIGNHLSPGIYVVRIQTRTRALTRKVILAR